MYLLVVYFILTVIGLHLLLTERGIKQRNPLNLNWFRGFVASYYFLILSIVHMLSILLGLCKYLFLLVLYSFTRIISYPSSLKTLSTPRI